MSATPATPPPINPHHHGGRVVFEVRFRSAMSGSELALLRRRLAITTHVEHKLPADPNGPGVARLDRDSSLLLEHAAADHEWVLQARSWGLPSERTVHAWQVCVAEAAHQLDPSVPFPERLPRASYDVPMRRVGCAANKRWAAVRRRLAGLP